MEVIDGGGGTNTGPGREGWNRRAVTIAEPGAEPPEESWTKDVDGGTLRVQMWGNGTPAAPWAVQVAYRATFTPNRFPTWEEIQEALHTLTEEGAVFSLPPFQINRESQKVILESLESPGWAMMPFIQTGAREGSEASKRSPIILMGGPHGRA